MAKIFSWKLTANKYAYLERNPETGSFIRNKITDTATLYQISRNVNELTEDEYRTAYNDMREEIIARYQQDIGDDYTIYYDTGEDDPTNKLILLSGKDGNAQNEGNSHIHTTSVLSEADYTLIQNAIDEKLSGITAMLENITENIMQYIDERFGAGISNTLTAITTAITAVTELQTQLETALSRNAEIAQSFGNISGSVASSLSSIEYRTNMVEAEIATVSGNVSSLYTNYDDLATRVQAQEEREIAPRTEAIEEIEAP